MWGLGDVSVRSSRSFSQSKTVLTITTHFPKIEGEKSRQREGRAMMWRHGLCCALKDRTVTVAAGGEHRAARRWDLRGGPGCEAVRPVSHREASGFSLVAMGGW